ncbi:MAG: NAD(P)/FAD-dependent oxidoreductase [Cyanobacteria bacterium J06597_1]
MERFDYVVLGAGLGGLSAAACLARQGYRVAALEQHYLPGGCCHTFPFGLYNFCADVHYISQCGPQQAIDQFLKYIGKNVPFNLLDLDCIDRVIVPGVDFRIPMGWERFRNRLIDRFPDEANAIHDYCDDIKFLHQQIRDLTNEVSWYDRKWTDWLKLPKYWGLFRRKDWTLQDLFDHLGLSPPVQAVLAGQSGDYALPPNEIALITHTSLVWDYSEGAYYPRYHFKQFVDAIVEAITERDGIVVYSTPISDISVRDGVVQSVTAGGDVYVAEQGYVSDLDPKLTVQLIDRGSQGEGSALSTLERERLTDYDYSASVFNIYLGLDDRFEPERYGIGNWNIWYYPTEDLNQAYRQQLEGNLEHPWIFMSCPTMKSTEPGMAPEGHHVLEIATVCPYAPFKDVHERDPKAYKAIKRGVYKQVMSSVLELIPDVNDYIRMKVFGTPTTSEFYLGQPSGNIYGAKLVPTQVGLNRMGYKTEVSNLMLVGATAGYPSVPGVITNGMEVAELLTGERIRERSPAVEGVSA